MNARLTFTTAVIFALATAGVAAAQPPVTAPLAPTVASTGASAAYDMPQTASAPQPTPKVVKPAAATPKVTLATAGDDPQAPPAPPAPPVPPQPPRAARAPEAPAPSTGFSGGQARVMTPRAFRGQLVNLRLEFTMTDQIGSATPVRKTVTMNVADGENGRIRTNAYVYRKAMGGGSERVGVPLSIDAKPELEGTKIRLSASLEYQLFNDGGASDTPGGTTTISQSVTSILSDGVQAILSQSADPLTDRKVTLEVKATIVK